MRVGRKVSVTASLVTSSSLRGLGAVPAVLWILVTGSAAHKDSQSVSQP